MGYLYEKTYRKLLENYKTQLQEMTFWIKIGLILFIILIFLYQTALAPIFIVLTYFYYKFAKKIETLKSFDEWNYFLNIFLYSYLIFLVIFFASFLVIKPSYIFKVKYYYKSNIYIFYAMNLRHNNDKRSNQILCFWYLAFSCISLSILLYDETGNYNEFYDDLLNGIIITYLVNKQIFLSYSYNIEFAKSLRKNDLVIIKYSNIFNNLLTPLVMINTTNKEIELNNAFKKIILNSNKTIITEEVEKLFYNSINYDEINKDESLNSFNNLESAEFKDFMEETSLAINNNSKSIISPKKAYKNLIFYKKLYFLSKILNQFYRKEEGNNKFVKGDLFNSFLKSKIFQENEEFLDLGVYQLIPDNNKIDDECILNMSYRKSNVEGIELINLIMDDITKIVKIEEEKADNKYRRQYLSNVAHEFKAPIQVLLLTILDINTEKLPKEEIIKFKDIENLSNYILLLIMDIISFSKDDKGVEVKFDEFQTQIPFLFGEKLINLLIRNNNTKKYAIKLNLSINPNVPKVVTTDETKVKQILINLLSNAFKFTSSGEININVDMIDSNDMYDEIQVQIEDTGKGIKAEDEHKLFKQFGKLTDYDNLNRQGTGLGLSICKNIIARIGNNIGYKNRKNGGSIFYFSFFNMKNKYITKDVESHSFKKLVESINEVEELNSKNIELPQQCFEKKIKKIDTSIHNKNSYNEIVQMYQKRSTKQLKQLSIKSTSLLNEKINIPTDVCEFYSINDNDSIFNDDYRDDEDVFEPHENINKDLSMDPCPYSKANLTNITKLYEGNDKERQVQHDKYISLFYDMYSLSQKYSTTSEFQNVYHHFKPYFRFFISKLKQVIDKKDISYFCIVDDTSIILKSLAKVINGCKNQTIEIIKAYDGVEALGLFKIDYYLGKNIKYIITDQNMTMMSGVDLLSLISKYAIEKKTKLFISSSDDENLKGCKLEYEFLSKPVSKKEILKIMNS